MIKQTKLENHGSCVPSFKNKYGCLNYWTVKDVLELINKIGSIINIYGVNSINIGQQLDNQFAEYSSMYFIIEGQWFDLFKLKTYQITELKRAIMEKCQNRDHQTLIYCLSEFEVKGAGL